MNKDDLKIYINENNLIPEILESIGLVHIRPVGQKYYSCGFPKSRRRDSINCYMNDKLSVKVWSKNEDIKDLFSLIKYQLGKNARWSIQSVAATGTASREYCYSTTDPLYVTIPDYENVNEIIDQVNESQYKEIVDLFDKYGR